ELGQVGGPLVVDALLRVERGLRQVYQGRRVDVDVVEAGVQLLIDERPYRLELGLGVDGVLLGVHLDVVALDEQRPREALPQLRGTAGLWNRRSVASGAFGIARDPPRDESRPGPPR